MAASGAHFRLTPRGPFSLSAANERFGGWTEQQAGAQFAVAMPFPVEGSWEPAVVVVRQSADGAVHGGVHAVGAAHPAWSQARAVLSLNVDGSGFAAVGEADPVIAGAAPGAAIQTPAGVLRPFPAPGDLLRFDALPGVPAGKIERGILMRAAPTSTVMWLLSSNSKESRGTLGAVTRLRCDRCT